MDDIEDYFDDDLVLDEQTLAILDREERKYLSQQRQPVVTKKLKTRDGWSPGIGSRTREGDFEDLPEISVTDDGNYGFTDTIPTSGHLNTSQSRRSSHFQPSIPPPRRTTHPKQRQSTSIPNPTPLRQQSIDQTPSVRTRLAGVFGQSGLEKQFAELQAHLRELNNENQKFQDALKEATEVRYAKEGEVSILRKNIEKTAQSHAAEIAKIKTAREEADAKQKQMEHQMKEEMEKLKTQFIFKQHELEASVRKPPTSVRATRVMKSIPATPGRVPSQITEWATNQGTGASQRLDNSPRKHPSPKQSPRQTRNGLKPPEIVKKSTFLPGFQNSFMTTPLKLGSKAMTKGKGRDIGREASFEIQTQLTSQKAAPPGATPTHRHPVDNLNFWANLNSMSNPDDPLPADEDGDVIMLDEVSEETAIEVEPIEPLNHKAELCRIILTHTHPHGSETTSQLLIGLTFSLTFSNIQAKECTQACQAILIALSNPVNDSDYLTCAHQVTKYLLLILRSLLTVDPCFPLTALLNLLYFLTSSLPSLGKVLLAHDAQDSEDSSLLVAICDLAERLVASSPDTTKACLGEMLSLLETLLCNIPDETVPRLALIPKRMNSLVALLKVSWPYGLVEPLSRVLLLLATHGSIYPQLSAPTEDGNLQEVQSFKDSPLVHGLCVYLLESLDDGPNQSAITTQSNLIGCLAQISLTQAETLAESIIVIPTVVYFVAHLATKLWNDDERYLPTLQARLMVRSINQGLFLLHHLVHSLDPTSRLHEKLQHSPHRNLNNLMHMFVVSFGQLSYCDAPDWIDREGKAELEGLVEPARELLDLVVDGPEGDSIWAAYQIEPDNESEIDEEEREARLMETEGQT